MDKRGGISSFVIDKYIRSSDIQQKNKIIKFPYNVRSLITEIVNCKHKMVKKITHEYWKIWPIHKQYTNQHNFYVLKKNSFNLHSLEMIFNMEYSVDNCCC